MFLQKGNNSMGLKTSLFVTFYIDINSKTKKNTVTIKFLKKEIILRGLKNSSSITFSI